MEEDKKKQLLTDIINELCLAISQTSEDEELKAIADSVGDQPMYQVLDRLRKFNRGD
jgi:hypothetical protein